MRTADITMAPVTSKVAKLLHALQAELLSIPCDALPPGSIVLSPIPYPLKGRYSDNTNSRWLECSDANNTYLARYNSPHIKPNWDFQHTSRPGVWMCEERRQDSNGGTWNRYVGDFVQDDFGTLVKAEVRPC